MRSATWFSFPATFLPVWVEKECYFLLISRAERLLALFSNYSTSGSFFWWRAHGIWEHSEIPHSQGTFRCGQRAKRDEREGRSCRKRNKWLSRWHSSLCISGKVKQKLRSVLSISTAETLVQDAVWNPKPWPLLMLFFLWSRPWFMYKNSLAKVLEISAQIICLMRFLSIALAL